MTAYERGMESLAKERLWTDFPDERDALRDMLKMLKNAMDEYPAEDEGTRL